RSAVPRDGGGRRGAARAGTLAVDWNEQAAAPGVHRRRHVARWERLTDRDRTGQRVVLAVRRGRSGGGDDPLHRGGRAQAGEHALAPREAEEVVELLVDALRLPLAVDAPRLSGDAVVLPLALCDGALEAVVQGHHQLGGDVIARRRQRPFGAEVDLTATADR